MGSIAFDPFVMIRIVTVVAASGCVVVDDDVVDDVVDVVVDSSAFGYP